MTNTAKAAAQALLYGYDERGIYEKISNGYALYTGYIDDDGLQQKGGSDRQYG